MPWVVTLTILVASAFLMDMSFTMITPFLPVYLSSALGAKASKSTCGQVRFCIKEKPRTVKVTSRNWFDWSVLRQPAIFKMLIACAVIHASLFSAQPILPLYIAQLQGSMDNIMMLSGTIFSVCAISIMIASPILGAAGQRFGFLKVLSCSLFFAGLLISAQVLGRTPFEFGVWRFIAGFAIAGLIPLVNSIISTECPPDKKGRSLRI